jgi:DNA polymerase-3 subunit gamma/tau
MGRALYRKYRPKNLSEVVGQEHVTTTLANAIAADKLGHAYLLTGPRGVGKTSIARILAHQLNDLEYDESQAHLDIIEIDAASNRRIDEIRDLRDKVHVLPAGAKYKVYIIDEVHMLTKEAFNALLKTLEEPPAHVVFILATTEAHKLPETIVSRTQHFSFKPIELAVLVDHLQSIATKESFKIDGDAVELVASHGDGSFRDSISLLDQVRGLGEHVTRSDVERLLGVAPAEALEKLISTLQTGNAGELFTLLTELRNQGLQAGSLASQLSERLRNLVIHDAAYQNSHATKLLHSLLGVGSSSQPDRYLELVLLDYIFAHNPVAAPSTPIVNQPVVDTPSKPVVKAQAVKTMPVAKVAVSEPEKPIQKIPSARKARPSSEPEQVEATGNFDIAAWPVILATLNKQYNTLYGILRTATPSTDGSTLTLACRVPFYQKQINEAKNRKIISDIITEQTGETVNIVCIVSKDQVPAENGPNDTITNVSDIFGGGEVLES